jgi:hypothetical protein
MLSKNYPPHDINKVFDMFEETINRGGVADKTGAELTLINKLFAYLPPEASEYGMMMLHGTPASELPQQAKDVMPLYVRFLNLAEYLEKVDALREVPASLTTEQIMERHKMMDSLEEHEKAFAAPLLGFKVNEETNEAEEAAEEDEQKEGSSALHLMNACAPVFACLDPLKTSLFYEKNLGFKATHLDDEKMPHIRLTRDNIVLALVESPVRIAAPSMYELIIYVTEPMLLYHELKAAGVKIIEELPEAKESEKASNNRQFVIEDCDGRRICISQSVEIV